MATRFVRGAAFAMLCVVWGSTWLAIRIGLEGAPPFLAASLRFVVASLTLCILATAFRSRWPANRTELSLVVFVGVVLFTLDYGLIYWGENNGVESGLSAILFATFPLQTALFANAFLREEHLTIQKLSGIVLGFGGIVLIFRGQIGSAGIDKAFPMLAIVLSATCAASATVAIKRWGHGTDPVTFNAFAMAVGAAGLATASLSAREPWSIPSWPEGIGAILYLALAGSVVTFVTWQWLLKTAEATSLSFVALITPITAVLLGASLGNETFDVIDLMGAGIVLGGIYVSISRRLASLGRAASGHPARTVNPLDPPNRNG
ncbi:MAG: DMT family transporter [Thermoplasmata archaeon]